MIPHWLYLEVGVISMVSAHQVAVMNKWVIRDLPAGNKRLGRLLAMTTKMLMILKTHSTLLGRAKTKKLVMRC
jgi:hypothetical protein